MKSFSAIILALAVSSPFVAALPAPGSGLELEARGPIYHALEVRDPRRGKHRHHGGGGNETVAAEPASSAAPSSNAPTQIGQDPTENGQAGNDQAGNDAAGIDATGNDATGNDAAGQTAGGGGPLGFLGGLLGGIL